MSNKNPGDRKSAVYMAKEAVAATSLLALGTAFELASRLSVDIKKEIAQWEDGFTFCLGVHPDGPYMTARKEGNAVKFLGMDKIDPDVAIIFKNLDSALMVFTGGIGNATAGAQKRFAILGNVTLAMQLNRVLCLVQMFLLPGIILNKTFKRPPKLSFSQLLVKGGVMAGLTPVLALNAYSSYKRQ